MEIQEIQRMKSAFSEGAQILAKYAERQETSLFIVATMPGKEAAHIESVTMTGGAPIITAEAL